MVIGIQISRSDQMGLLSATESLVRRTSVFARDVTFRGGVVRSGSQIKCRDSESLHSQATSSLGVSSNGLANLLAATKLNDRLRHGINPIGVRGQLWGHRA